MFADETEHQERTEYSRKFAAFVSELDPIQTQAVEDLLRFVAVGTDRVAYLEGAIRVLAVDSADHSLPSLSDLMEADAPATPEMYEQNVQELHAMYNLEYQGNQLVCSKCGMPYATAGDAVETHSRHDGCPGCHQKSKWG